MVKPYVLILVHYRREDHDVDSTANTFQVRICTCEIKNYISFGG